MIESRNVVDNLLDSLFYRHICSDLKVFFSQGRSSTLDSDFEDWLRLIEFYREKVSELCFIPYRFRFRI